MECFSLRTILRKCEDPSQLSDYQTGNLPVDDKIRLRRGSTVELSGTAASGKTAIACQYVLDALDRSHRVDWISSHEHPFRRLAQVLEASDRDPVRVLRQFQHFHMSNLAQLLVYLNKGPNDSDLLVVVDNLTSLVIGAYPNYTESQTARRRAAYEDLLSRMDKMKAHHHVTFLLVTQMLSRTGVRLDTGIASGPWDRFISSRARVVREDDFVLNIEGVSFAISDGGIRDLQETAGGREQQGRMLCTHGNEARWDALLRVPDSQGDIEIR